MDLTLDPALADDMILTEEDWLEAQERLNTDAEFRALIARLFREGLSPNDSYGAPLWFPESWLDPIPDLEGGTKITVTASGEAYGYFFEWGECVIRGGGPGDCWTPVPSPSGYEPFHQSDAQVITASGERKIVKAGMIGVGGHAPDNATFHQAIKWYNHPERGRMIGRLHENGIGGYFHGALLPQATFADVALIRASALSGHWEYRDRIHTAAGRIIAGYDCLGPCMVTRPGLPLTRETQFKAEGEVVVASGGRMSRHRKRIMSSISVASHPFVLPLYYDLVELQEDAVRIKLEDGRELEEREDGTFAPVGSVAAGAGCACNKEEKPEPVTATVSEEQFTALADAVESLTSKVSALEEMVVEREMAAVDSSL